MNKRIVLLLMSVLTLPAIVDGLDDVDRNTYADVSIIDIEMPISLPVTMSKNGNITTSDTVRMVNNTSKRIALSNVNVITTNGWSLGSFDKDYSTFKVGLKEFGFKIDDINIKTDGSVDLPLINIEGNSTLNIPYAVNVAPQGNAITDTYIANVVLTVGWGTDGDFYPELEDKWDINLNNMLNDRNSLGVVSIDNEIYSIGGYDNGRYLNKVEVYNTSINKWVEKKGMPTYRYGLGAVVVGGEIYCIGGIGASAYNKIEVYNPLTDSWRSGLASMPSKRYRMGTVVVGDKIYCIGGEDDKGYLSIMEVYDPTTDSWEVKGYMSKRRTGLGAVAVDGKIYCIGGYDGSTYLNTIEVYDTVSGKWETKKSMPVAKRDFGAVVVNNKIYCIGGFNSSYLDRVDVYDIATDSWETRESMPSKRAYLSSVVVNGKIYCIGGFNGGQWLGTVESYDTGWRFDKK